MSATKSAPDSPSGSRKTHHRPEIQRYIPGKSKFKRPEQQNPADDSQRKLFDLIDQKQRFKNEKVQKQQQPNMETKKRERTSSRNTNAPQPKETNNNTPKPPQKATQKDDLSKSQKSEAKGKPPRNPKGKKQRGPKRSDSRQNIDNPDAKSDTSRASTTSTRGNNRSEAERNGSSKFQEFRNQNQNHRETNGNRKDDRQVVNNNSRHHRQNNIRQQNMNSREKNQVHPKNQPKAKADPPRPKTPGNAPENEKTPQVTKNDQKIASSPMKTADWGDLMNQEDEGFAFDSPLPRRDSWASEMNKDEQSRNQSRPSVNSNSKPQRNRPAKINEETVAEKANPISVIRLTPSQMPRVRKESEKYNASDSDGYNYQNQPVYGNRERARPKPRGGKPRGNYDPDYDRNINRYRGQGDAPPNNRSNERVVEIVTTERRRGKEYVLKDDLEDAIKDLKWSYEKMEFPKTQIPEKKRALDIFTQLITFHSFFTFQEKIFNLVWQGVFYREVELFRRLLENTTEDDVSSMTSKYLDNLLNGVDFYSATVSRMEEKFQFNIRYYEDNGIKMAQTKQLKMCLYLCQQFFIHMGDLSRYIEQLDKSVLPRDRRKLPNSREFYTTAKNLDPRHAKPHYQLGVLSTEQQRHFEAIIHYVRAASVEKSGGSSTAMSLNKEFEMARREAVSFLGRKEQQKETTKKLENGDTWMMKMKLAQMPKEQLNKRFKLTFLAALGRIYTGIDPHLVKEFLEQAYDDLDILLSITKQGDRPYVPAGFLVELAVAAVFGMHTSVERKQNEKDALMMYFGLMCLLCRRLRNKLKTHMKSYPDGDIYIIGDGMVRLISIPEIQNRITHVHPSPGKTMSGLKQYIDQNLSTITTGPTVPVCFLHVGTDDASTLHHSKPIPEIEKDFRELVIATKAVFPNAIVYFSEILPRWDSDNERAQSINKKIKLLADELGIKYMGTQSIFQRKDLFNTKDKDAVYLNDKGKKALSAEFTKHIEKELCSHNDFGNALEQDQVGALLPALRILMEYLNIKHLHSMFASQRIKNVDTVGTCGEILADVANMISRKPLPVQVTTSPSPMAKEEINCIECIDLQGFKPLRGSGMSTEWWSAKNSRLRENTVRMAVIAKTLDDHAQEENRVIRFHRGQFMPSDNDKTRQKLDDQKYLVKYVVPDTNCWIEKSDNVLKLIKAEHVSLEVLVSLFVRYELEGLTKSESRKVATKAEESLKMITTRRLRFVTSKGVILPAGKALNEAKPDKMRNDDVIKNSVKTLKNSVLLTDDKNLMLKSRSEKVPVMIVRHFLEWINAS